VPTDTPRPASSASQLQVFEELWNIVDNYYLYPDFNGLDWDAVYDEYRPEIEAGLYDEDFYWRMDEMVARLGDEHSVFFSPQEVDEIDAEYAGEYDYVGIGVFHTAVPERERVTIILVFPGSPAEVAGLKAHDSILAADGQPIIDESGVRSDLIRGPEGTIVELTVQTPGEEPRQVPVTRGRITSSLPVPYEVFTTPSGKRVGYILLMTFGDSTVDEGVDAALRAMTAEGPLDGLIIDNRHNGGGASDVFSDTLAYFSEGTLGHFINRQEEKPLNITGVDINGSLQVPIVVLVGDGTASFGEIFSGILGDIGRAYIIGETTEGNVEILYVYNFSDGSRAWIARETFRPLNNPEQNWEQTGIVPDLVVPSEWDLFTLATDPAVQAALEYLN
jgi:C-terminal peptidase prc